MAMLSGESNEVPDEMLAELGKEIERNVEATRLVKEREQEACHARNRAAESQRRMREMMVKYNEMKKKLEWTRRTLAETSTRLELHNSSRETMIVESVMELKERANSFKRKLGNNGEISPASPEEAGDDSGVLTDTERMLLELWQRQRKEDSEFGPGLSRDGLISASASAESFYDRAESPSPKPFRDYGQTVLDLRMKLASGKKSKSQVVEANCSNETHVEELSLLKDKVSNKSLPSMVDPAVDLVETKGEMGRLCQRQQKEDYETSHWLAQGTTISLSSLTDQLDSEEPPTRPVKDIDLEMKLTVEKEPEQQGKEQMSRANATNSEATQIDEEVTKNLNETVSRMDCVREELGQMAMSEQYMRTKQAQLLAKRREKEAAEAVLLASKKEQEVQEMKRKVTGMMKLLEERKNKLRMTEHVLEKKAVVVEKVNKILDNRERRGNYLEKHRYECLAFDRKPKGN